MVAIFIVDRFGHAQKHCIHLIKMAAEGEGARTHRWYFTKEELAKSPSRADGVDPEKELRYRQDAASLIQEMGPRLSLWVAQPIFLSFPPHLSAF